jgi:hypothetical protein
MKRILVITAAACALVACGGGHKSVGSTFVDYAPHAPRSNVTPLANRREHLANRKAQELLERLALPPGAVGFDQVPFDNQELNHSGLGVSTVNMTADRYSFWRVPGSGQALLAFEKRHMLPGLRSVGGGSSPDGYAGDEFDGPIIDGSPRREVTVTVVPINGQTYVRLDAGVAWIYPRSPQEVIPAGVRRIDIRDGAVRRRVTDPAQVTQIVRWFNALHVSQPGPAVECVAILALQATFVFRSASGARLATAGVPSTTATNCDSIAFSIGGKRQGPLIDATMGKNAFAFRVERLLGLKWPCRIKRACR